MRNSFKAIDWDATAAWPGSPYSGNPWDDYPTIYAWFFYTKPVLARTALGYFFLGGAGVRWASAQGIIALRNGLRNRIQPNRHFPHPPKLPPGVPTAFIVDPTSGELTPAIADISESEFRNGWLDFRIGHDHIPPLCCDCLQPTFAGNGHKTKLTSTMQLEIPRCPTARWPRGHTGGLVRNCSGGVDSDGRRGGMVALRSRFDFVSLQADFVHNGVCCSRPSDCPVKARSGQSRGVVSLHSQRRIRQRSRQTSEQPMRRPKEMSRSPPN